MFRRWIQFRLYRFRSHSTQIFLLFDHVLFSYLHNGISISHRIYSIVTTIIITYLILLLLLMKCVKSTPLFHSQFTDSCFCNLYWCKDTMNNSVRLLRVRSTFDRAIKIVTIEILCIEFSVRRIAFVTGIIILGWRCDHSWRTLLAVLNIELTWKSFWRWDIIMKHWESYFFLKKQNCSKFHANLPYKNIRILSEKFDKFRRKSRIPPIDSVFFY